MKRLAIVLTVVVLAIIGILMTGPFYIINEGELAVVVRLGEKLP